MDTAVNCCSDPCITLTDVVRECRDKGTRVVRVLDGFVGSAIYGVHNPSLVNLCRGIVERVLKTRSGGVLGTPVRPIDGVFSRLSSIRAAVIRCTRPTPVVDVDDYPYLYSGRKRAVYLRAVESLRTRAVVKLDAFVNTFVKAEKVNFSAKPDPAPRVIQPRSPRYNVCVGVYLKCFEKAVFEGFAAAYGYGVIVKGLNAQGVASRLFEAWEAFVDPVAIGLDASRFDQHVSCEALKFEHGFYNGCYKSKELNKLLSWQLDNTGYGYAEGKRVKYNVQGCRMSGDINTSMGNCIIMSSIVLGYFDHVGLKARLVNNGDDCVVVCSRCDLHMLGGIDQWFREFGFVLTREPVVDVFEQIEFCQTQPVFTTTGYRMVRNPYTATTKDMVSLLSWASELEFDRWRGAIADCGLALTQGVPYWEAFYRRLGGIKHELSLETIMDSGLGFMARGVVANSTITPEVRYSFWLAFGMSPDAQVELEDLHKEIVYTRENPLTFGDVKPLSELLTNGKI